MSLGAGLVALPRTLRRAGWLAVGVVAPRRRVRSRGLTFTLQCDNWITRFRWQTYNSKEPQTLDWIDRWVREGDVLFDVGANIGVYTMYAALRHPRARIVAFEPEYANLHLLRDNIMRNQLQKRVEVYSVALGRRCGVSRLHVQDLTPGTALHTESSEPLQVTAAGRPVVWHEGIYTMTLDTFCDELRVSPNAIKIDVDGTEPNVLEGAARTLGSPSLRSVLIERPVLEAARSACEARLSDAGFTRVQLGGDAPSCNDCWVRDHT